MATANATESSVRAAGVTVPLMIMRGDGGVMEISEMRKRPILTAMSGPAASVMGSLMYLRASNAVYFEVGGTTTNIGVIKNGRPGVDYAIIGGHPTYINSLDVRILGTAGGSMVRINDKEVVDVGPRSAHIAGCEYAAFTPEEEIVDPQVELIQPKKGDPSDYVVIRLASGKRITITNTCAANVLGLIEPQYFAHGNANSARKAMQPVADKLGITVEELARQILDKSFEKVNQCITELADKYQLDHDQIKLVGCGGGRCRAHLLLRREDGRPVLHPRERRGHLVHRRRAGDGARRGRTHRAEPHAEGYRRTEEGSDGRRHRLRRRARHHRGAHRDRLADRQEHAI